MSKVEERLAAGVAKQLRDLATRLENGEILWTYYEHTPPQTWKNPMMDEFISVEKDGRHKLEIRWYDDKDTFYDVEEI